jgi:hypothetical protein
MPTTQKAQHTPGPWEVIRHNDDTAEIVSYAEEGFATVLLARDPDFPLRPPDARLMVAAPDLLAALRNIVANSRLIPDPAMGGTTDTYSVPLDDIEAARAAIARVEGRG